MSEYSPEDYQFLKILADKYYLALNDFECLSVECLKNCRCVTGKEKTFLNAYFPGRKFLDFLQEFPDHFFIENHKVSQYDASLEGQRQSAVDYFVDILNDYTAPVGILNLRGHIGQADDLVINFVNSFYPGKEFKLFLQSNPDIFVVNEDGTVWSCVNECVQFYKQRLIDMGEEIYYYDLLRNSSRATPQTKAFLRNNYPGEQFLGFLAEHPDHFQVDETLSVTFSGSEFHNYEDEYDEDCGSEYDNYENDEYDQDIEEEAAAFFHAILESCLYSPHFMRLRNYNSQAIKDIKVFIDENYPGEMFKHFLLSQTCFVVKDDDTVSLPEEECVSFLEERLQILGGGLHYEVLNIHISQAHINVRNHMREFYPNDSFQTFLQNHSEHFYMDENGLVFLCNDESESSCSEDIGITAAEYFHQFLNRNDRPPHYMDFRGHIGQAPKDIVKYINDFFPNEAFETFLLNHPEFFVLNQSGTVCGTENESVNYFVDILEEIGGEIYWYNLQLHLLQASDCLKTFFQNNFPGEEFREFFQSHIDKFRIEDNGLVSLVEQNDINDSDSY